jgi:hypothetical protein
VSEAQFVNAERGFGDRQGLDLFVFVASKWPQHSRLARQAAACALGAFASEDDPWSAENAILSYGGSAPTDAVGHP